MRDPRLESAGQHIEEAPYHVHRLEDISGLAGALHNRIKRTEPVAASSIAIGPVTAAHDGSASNAPPNGITAVKAYQNGWPTSYGNVILIGGAGKAELFLGWRSDDQTGDVHYRSRRDTSGTPWGQWRKVAMDPSTDPTANTTALRDSAGNLHAVAFYGTNIDIDDTVYCDHVAATSYYASNSGEYNLHNVWRVYEAAGNPGDVYVETKDSLNNWTSGLVWHKTSARWVFDQPPMVGGDYVVTSGDSRLSDARAPTTHTQTASTISDSTATGRAVLTAADAAAARMAIGATYGSMAGTVCQGNDSRLSDARTPTAHNHSDADLPTSPSFSGTVSAYNVQAYLSDLDFYVQHRGTAYISIFCGGNGWNNGGMVMCYGKTHASNSGSISLRCAGGSVNDFRVKANNLFYETMGGSTYDLLHSGASIIPSVDYSQNIGSTTKRWQNVHAVTFYGSNVDVDDTVYCNHVSGTSYYAADGGEYNLHNVWRVREDAGTPGNISVETKNSGNSWTSGLVWYKSTARWAFANAPMVGLDYVVTSSDSRLSDARAPLSHDHASISGNAATATVAASCSGNAATATVAASCSGNAATATTAASCSGTAANANTLDGFDSSVAASGSTIALRDVYGNLYCVTLVSPAVNANGTNLSMWTGAGVPAGTFVHNSAATQGNGNRHITFTPAPSWGNPAIGTTAGDLLVSASLDPDGNGTRNLGWTSLRWANIYLINSPNVSSDIRLKENISRIDAAKAANLVHTIEPIEFTRPGDCGVNFGFSAQDVEVALGDGNGGTFGPRAVVEHCRESDSYGLKPDQLIPVLWAVVRKQQEQIDELRRAIDVRPN